MKLVQNLRAGGSASPDHFPQFWPSRPKLREMIPSRSPACSKILDHFHSFSKIYPLLPPPALPLPHPPPAVLGFRMGQLSDTQLPPVAVCKFIPITASHYLGLLVHLSVSHTAEAYFFFRGVILPTPMPSQPIFRYGFARSHLQLFSWM